MVNKNVSNEQPTSQIKFCMLSKYIMYYKVLVVLYLSLVVVVCFGNEDEIVEKSALCIKKALPASYWYGGDLYIKDYWTYISKQWDPLSRKSYLWWPYNYGVDDWTQSCYLTATFDFCLEALTKAEIRMKSPIMQSPSAGDNWWTIYAAKWLLLVCKHKFVLADPASEHADCAHNRILSDPVQRCNSILTSVAGQSMIILDMCIKPLKDMIPKSVARVYREINKCIYREGNWRKICGFKVDEMMSDITQQFSHFNFNFLVTGVFYPVMCSRCQRSSDINIYKQIAYRRWLLLVNLFLHNQVPYAFDGCSPNEYALNICHIRRIWRQSVYTDFCHNITTDFIPIVQPYLPLCDIDNWINSVTRLCKMGYETFMNIASHIGRCTNSEDELFPCYKGTILDPLSHTLITAGKIWPNIKHRSFKKALPFVSPVYKRIKDCVPQRYDYLRKTCRYGPAVVQLIQDLRVTIGINPGPIFSQGLNVPHTNGKWLVKTRNSVMC